jgi:hypothetical protein
LGGRLKLELLPSTTSDTVLSRERVNGFNGMVGAVNETYREHLKED